jgi:hypothetical protein
VGQAGWPTVLENNKQAYANAFVQRSQFSSAFPTSTSPATFVDTLFRKRRRDSGQRRSDRSNQRVRRRHINN